MAVELATAYVSIVPTTKGIQRKLAAGLRGIDSVAGEAGDSMGRTIGDRMSKVLSVASKAVGVAAGAALAKGLTGGVQRLVALEDAEKRLDSMGLTAKESAGLMQSLTDVLTGTPFALDAGASALARFVSSGVDLEKIPGLLASVTDAAAFGQTDLNEVANIFSRIATNGRLSAMEMEMLADRNIPALGLLASAAGVTEVEMRDMISNSEIDAERFFQLWEQGAKGFGDRNIKMAGAAKSAGDTTRGAWANMLTALNRVGATLAGPIFGLAQGFFTGVSGWLDDANTALKDFDLGGVLEAQLARAGDALAPVVDLFRSIDWAGVFDALLTVGGVVADFVSANFTPILYGLAAAAAFVVGGAALMGVVAAVSALANPLVLAAGAVAVLAAAFTAAYSELDWFRSGVDAVVSGATDAVGGLIEVGGEVGSAWGSGGLSGVIDALADAWGRLETPVKAVAVAFAGFAVLFSVPAFFAALGAGAVVAYQKIEPFRRAVDSVVDALGAAWRWLAGLDWGGALGGIGRAVVDAFSAVGDALGSIDWGGVFGTVGTFLAPVVDAVGGLVDAVLDLAKPVGGVLLSAFRAISPLFAAVGKVLKALAPVALVVAKVVGVALFLAWKKLEVTFRAVAAVIGWVANTVLPVIASVIDTVVAPIIQWFADYLTNITAPALQWLGEVANTVFGAIVSALSAAWSFLEPIFSAIADWVGNVLATAWSNFMDVAGPVFSWIADKVAEGWARVQPILALLGDFVGSVLVGHFQVVQGVASTAWDAISTAVSVAWGVIQPVFSAVADFLGGVLSGAFDGFLTTAQIVWEGVSTVIGAQWDVISGIWEGMKSAISGVADWIGDRIDDIAGVFRSFKDTASNIFDTIGDVMTAPIRLAMNVIKRLWNSTLGGFSISIPDFPGIPGRGQSFSIPKMHSGGVVPGRRGDEVLRLLEAGELVIPADMTRQMMGAPEAATVERRTERGMDVTIINPSSTAEVMAELRWAMARA